MDVSRYARFERPGHAVTGDRSPRWRKSMHSQRLVGYDFAHAIVDDHSRLAYVELHRDERAATVTGFVERALAFYARHGVSAKRLMTDNAFAYVNNRSLREPGIRLWSAYALGNIGDRNAVPGILDLLEDSDRFVRMWAVMALGEIGDRSVIARLIPLLQHPDWFLRIAAVYALTLIDEPESRKAAAAQYRRERPLKRRRIRRNLRKFAKRRGLKEAPKP